jgi:hypothetical protein
MLIVIMLIVIMVSVIMLSVIMLSIVAQFNPQDRILYYSQQAPWSTVRAALKIAMHSNLPLP